MPEDIYIRWFVVSPFETNCYLVADPATKDAIVIDPGDNPAAIADAVRTDGLTVVAIVNTHAHADHIGANGALKREFGCPIMVHRVDAPALGDADVNLASLAGLSGELSPPADRLLEDGDEIGVGSMAFRVIHTPGHTPGGICLLTDDHLFSGDTLFAGSVGRSDFPGGSHDRLIAAIKEKLLALPDETVVYPGHGPQTTIGRERETNPWLE